MTATRSLGTCLFLAATLVASATLAAPDTLVTKDKDGNLKPGAAIGWEGSVNTTVFELAEDVDGLEVARILSERLASAKVSFVDGKLTVDGIPPAALLEQLSTLSLSGDADPLADLGGLGGAVIAMDTPEGGGSIRASKPTADSARPDVSPTHDPKERVEAEVLEVKRGTFPQVVLKLKMRRTVKSGPLKMKLRKGAIVEVPVTYATTDAGLDLRLPANQSNLVAYYLEKGDRIYVHPIAGKGDSYVVDWVARKAKK